MSAFRVNYARGMYHPDERVNTIIRNGKNSTSNNAIYVMVEKLEQVLGSKGSWKTQQIASQYQRRSITFDQFVAQYLDLPRIDVSSEERGQELDALRSKLWMEQALAYEAGDQVEHSESTEKLVKRLVQKHLFRNCIFTTEDLPTFQRPNFVILDDKDRQNASQSSIISDILFTHLGKSEDTIAEKVHWWKAYSGDIYKHFSALRSNVVRTMYSNFIQLYENEQHVNTPSETADGGTTTALDSSVDNYIDTPFNLLLLVCDRNRAQLADEVLDANIEKDAYRAFLDVCASAFFPKEQFKKHMKSNALSNVLTETEEAFALLSLENNFDRWMWCAERGKKTTDTLSVNDGIPNLRYQTNPGKRKDNKINAGKWTSAGKKRMNELLEKVSEARVDRKDFEKDLQRMYYSGCSSEEVSSNWLKSNNLMKKRTREFVPVKNCLSIITKRAAI